MKKQKVHVLGLLLFIIFFSRHKVSIRKVYQPKNLNRLLRILVLSQTFLDFLFFPVGRIYNNHAGARIEYK